jgi:hypothetical protein
VEAVPVNGSHTFELAPNFEIDAGPLKPFMPIQVQLSTTVIIIGHNTLLDAEFRGGFFTDSPVSADFKAYDPLLTNLTLRGLIFRNGDGSALGFGGMLSFTHPINLDVQNCTFTNCAAPAVFVKGSSARITDCIFSGIRMPVAGNSGGVEIAYGDMNITNCTFFNNTGAAIYSGRSSGQIVGCKFMQAPHEQLQMDDNCIFTGDDGEGSSCCRNVTQACRPMPELGKGALALDTCSCCPLGQPIESM